MSYVFGGYNIIHKKSNVFFNILIHIYFFSHEGVHGILMWGFWNKAHWKPDAAIVNGDDLVPNLAGKAYIRQEFRNCSILNFY